MGTKKTELDDAIEQVLGRYLTDSIARIRARNEICSLISAAGLDATAATVPCPDDLSPAMFEVVR